MMEASIHFREPENHKMEDQIRAHVARECGLALRKVSLSSDLFGDLDIAGDDGGDLMSLFAQEFQVELAGFDSEKIFSSEAACCNPLGWLFPSWWRWQRERTVLTVADLAALTKAGSWAAFVAHRSF